MKQFEEPKVEVVEFSVEDVVTTSMTLNEGVCDLQFYPAPCI